MRSHPVRGFALVSAVFLAAISLTVSASANSLYQGSVGSSGVVGTALPGQALWTYYQTIQMGQICPPGANAHQICNTDSNGDNIIRLINPNGAANGNLAGAKPQTVCAMIYVFDKDQEMGECCGCPLSSAQLATFSVIQNLTANWALAGADDGATSFDPSNGLGAIAIIAATPNTGPTCAGLSGACHGGCDPTNIPGYSVTIANNLLGSITHNQLVAGNPLGGQAVIGITEIPLSDDGGGNPTNLIYLQNQCGALIGNSTLGGFCNCPVE
jgi:hypothetical protein